MSTIPTHTFNFGGHSNVISTMPGGNGFELSSEGLTLLRVASPLQWQTSPFTVTVVDASGDHVTYTYDEPARFLLRKTAEPPMRTPQDDASAMPDNSWEVMSASTANDLGTREWTYLTGVVQGGKLVFDGSKWYPQNSDVGYDIVSTTLLLSVKVEFGDVFRISA